MNMISATAPVAADCAHCAAPLRPGQGRFCCEGCAGAHAIVSGLGLDGFYRRRQAAAGALRPSLAPAASLLPHVEAQGSLCRVEVLLSGLHCGACVWLVEQALTAEPDVLAARVTLSQHRLTLRWRGTPERADAFAALLGRLGFAAAPWSAACLRATEDAEGQRLLRALGLASFGALNVMLISFAVWAGTGSAVWAGTGSAGWVGAGSAGMGMGEATRQALHWVAAAIALPTIAVAGLPFFRPAWAALRAGRPSMDLAVSLGVLAAAAMSLSEAIRGGPYVWFDSATALLALLLAGRVLDRAARGRARRAVAELLSLQDGEARLLRPDGSVAPTPVEAVEPGARLLLAPGERLRLDGVLEGGHALLDTAAITGESVPRDFAAGAAIPAGAVNMGAACVVRVTHAARDGSLARMGALLAEAERARGRHVALADRVARWFVPAIHAIAAATFALWWLALGAPWQVALMHAVAVRIVTCPCGLAIAVPAVQVVTVGALFRRGVLVASGTALERLAAVTHVVLDKTGTLTEGRPRLLPDPARDPAVLHRAAGMAQASRHPLTRALARACPDAPAAPGVVEHPGEGLALGGTRLGSARFCGLDDGEGMTLWLTRPGAPPAAFHFADGLRPDAAAAVRALRGLGLEVELLSGDATPAVAAAAREAGLERWEGVATPARKAARVRELTATGARVLMVGDGINDAAAMALAHASASPGEGTDLARQVADLVLQGGRLLALPDAVARARRAMRLSRQNLAMSLAYNALAVPAAVAGLVNPLLAAGVMATSSLAVILNALRAGR